MPDEPLKENEPKGQAPRDQIARLHGEDLTPFWLNAIIESADDAIITKTLQGIITSWNKGAERIFGYTADEVIGQPVNILIPEDHPDEEPAILARLRAGQRIRHYETVRVRKDGTLIDISLTVSPIRNAEGLIIGASKIARDITEQKRVERALRESEEKYRSLLENANDLIYSHDLEGNYLTINRACEVVTGYTREEILGGLNIAQVVAPDHLELARQMMRAKLNDPSPTIYEIDIITKDKRRLTLEVSTRVAHREGQKAIIEGVGRDITERKRSEREREELLRREQQARQEAETALDVARNANRLKDEFLATVSHELRTPLTAILGWAHLLRTGQLGEKSAANALEIIERNARTQSQLIDDLLDVSRIITGKLRLDVREVEPTSFIELAIEALRPAAEAKGVRIQRVMDTGAVNIAGDPARLQQIIWNLISNAIKFTPRGGRVQVRLARVNSHLEIAVSDTGAGIKPEFLPHVFERFRQEDQTTTRHHGGLGLGLAIVRHLVELHGGTVEAESEGEGLGATFIVKLPLIPVYQRERREERVHPAARETLLSYDCPDRLDGTKILVVDDELDTRELLKASLSQCGASVVTAGSAQEALVLLEREKPTVLVSDIGMPDEDGYDLIGQVRALPEKLGGRIPAIALTAYARTADRMRALRAGYQMHVTKPVETPELVAVIASLIGRSTPSQ